MARTESGTKAVKPTLVTKLKKLGKAKTIPNSKMMTTYATMTTTAKTVLILFLRKVEDDK